MRLLVVKSRIKFRAVSSLNRASKILALEEVVGRLVI